MSTVLGGQHPDGEPHALHLNPHSIVFCHNDPIRNVTVLSKVTLQLTWLKICCTSPALLPLRILLERSDLYIFVGSVVAEHIEPILLHMPQFQKKMDILTTIFFLVGEQEPRRFDSSLQDSRPSLAARLDFNANHLAFGKLV